MQAIRCTRYGPPEVLELSEVDKPAPTDHQVLVRVHAASVNTADLAMRGFLVARLFMGGLRKPKDPRLGIDLAGRVEAVGRAVTQFQPGDDVFGRARGAFAEYVCAREEGVVLKPPTLTFAAAAAVPQAAAIALQAVRDDAQIQPGEQVLINGASGGVGTYALQLAKVFGAHVTAVCSPRNVEQVHGLGADQVLDYTQQDCTRTGQRYDVILGVNGYHSLFVYRRALRPTGRYVLVGAGQTRLLRALLEMMLLGPVVSRMGRQRMRLCAFKGQPPQQDLAYIKELLEAGKLVPVIDRCYPLSETAAALRYLESGHVRSKVIITMDPQTRP
ncbi:MAG TPA: NAD(P)-dependent alcohol dehydrogenase [Chloroflexia bacterium]|nr:NAD(P)-dependent alcohol dehydrogenase [Chloroflexia bacterium]